MNHTDFLRSEGNKKKKNEYVPNIIVCASRSNKDPKPTSSAAPLLKANSIPLPTPLPVPVLKSPPDFTRRRPSIFQLKKMSGRAWDPDLLGGSNNSLGGNSRSRGGSAGPEDVRWASNGDSNKK